jgi:hypothetical protein
VELVWTAERDGSLDVYHFARNLMTSAIEALNKDGNLQASAFVVTKEKIYGLAIQFEECEQKLGEYDKAVEFARSKGAFAIVTLNDAYLGNTEDAENYYPGKIKELKKQEGVYITVTGPDLKNWSLTGIYERKGKRFAFTKMEEDFGGEVNFLQDWPANFKSVN